MERLSVLKNSLLLLLVLLVISCKKTCYDCSNTCFAFEGSTIIVYCLDLFETEEDYERFVDSMLLIKEMTYIDTNDITVCDDDRSILKYLNHWSITCEKR